MTPNSDELSTLEKPMVLDGGKKVAFTVKTAVGAELRVHCAIPVLGDIFSFLGQLAEAAGKLRSAPTPPSPQARNYLAPVPAQGMGLQAGRSPDEMLLVIRLSGFDMAFAVPSSGVVRLADDFVRKAHELAPNADEPRN